MENLVSGRDMVVEPGVYAVLHGLGGRADLLGRGHRHRSDSTDRPAVGDDGSGARGPSPSGRRRDLILPLRSLARGREAWRHACGGGTWCGRGGKAAAAEGRGEHGCDRHQLRRHLLAAHRRRIGLAALGEKGI